MEQLKLHDFFDETRFPFLTSKMTGCSCV